MALQKNKSLNPAVVLGVVSLICSFALLVAWTAFAIDPNPGQELFDDWLNRAIPAFIACLACSLIAVGTAIGAMVSSGVTKRAWPLSLAALAASIGPWVTLLVLSLLP